MYFDKVKEGDEVYGLVFGKGVVNNVYNGFYKFEVEYLNDYIVPYTEDGVPSWNIKFDYQTVFYKNDINIMDYDFSINDDKLSPKKIIKLRTKNKLEIRCPSGLWQDVHACPDFVVHEYLENEKFDLFRAKK